MTAKDLFRRGDPVIARRLAEIPGWLRVTWAVVLLFEAFFAFGMVASIGFGASMENFENRDATSMWVATLVAALVMAALLFNFALVAGGTHPTWPWLNRLCVGIGFAALPLILVLIVSIFTGAGAVVLGLWIMGWALGLAVSMSCSMCVLSGVRM